MTIYRGSGGTGEARTDTDITEVREIMMEAKGYRDEAQTAAAEVEIDLTAVNEARDDTEGFKNEAEGFAQDASDSADAAAASEVNSAASANSAGLSATNAAASETAAAASEANAADSETAAAASAAAALASETASATSETNAATSEDNAAASESAAAASEAAALASENAAATSETNAAASETAAAASAAAAAASFDDFDDRYLGAKSSDPTVDNDGNTLLVGALYWSTPAAEFRAWDGSAWQGFGGLPSQDGASGKFLYSDGSNASWENVPDPQPATPTDDGLVYGDTDDFITENPTWSGYFIWRQSAGNYIQAATGSTGVTAPATKVSVTLGWNVGDPLYMNITGNGYIASGIYFLGNFHSESTVGTIILLNPNHPAAVTTTETGSVPDYPNAQGVIYTPSVGGNTSLGYESNEDNGSMNTSIGYGAGSTITTGFNNTVVGYNAEPSSATVNNEATLGNSSTTKTRLWGAIAVDDDTGTSGQVLTSNGTGSATWETPASAPVTSVNGYTGAVSLTASDVGAATSSDISTAIAALVDSAPATLDTLNELAAALGDDANFASTVTTALAAKAPLSNPTFTGTVTADYLVGDGSGITGIDSFPSQTGHSGEYLTTDGTNVSWAAVDALPDQTGNSGKYLTTDGSAASWAVLDTDANTTTKGLYEMANTISTTYAITAGNNAMSAGPITVTGSVTVPSGSVWTIV